VSKKTSIAISTILVLTLGLTTIWSTTPKLFLTQVLILVLSFLVLLIFAKLDLKVLLSLSPILYVFSIVLLIATLFFGSSSRGATRWLGPIQTSEMVKPLLVLFYAYFLTHRSIKTLKDFIFFIILATIPAILVKSQPDLGTAIVLILTAVLMAAFSGMSSKVIVFALVSLTLVIPLAPKLLKPYQIDRIRTFIRPHEDLQGRGYNAAQAVIAIGSGGLIGKGVRLGTQSHLNFLPERHTDFIFASFAEEFGLVGVGILLTSYFYLIFVLLGATQAQKEKPYRLLFVGIIAVFLIQIIVNIGMNLGLLPVTGITLPLFSYGGSSLLSFMALLGITVNLLELNPKFKI